MIEDWRKQAAAMAAIVLALGVVELAWGERIGVNAGQGWDGQAYLRWSGDFWHRVVELGVTKFHAQRVLPSAIVYYVLHALGVAPTVAHHVTAFAVLDLAMLVAAAVLWAHLARAVLGWPRGATWVGFAALLLCFANARHALYDPVLVDATAFGLGMLLAWGYLARRAWAVWLAGAAGALTWPALPALAIAMLILPRPREPVAPVDLAPRWRRSAALALAVLAATAFLLVGAHFYAHPVPGVGDDKFAAWMRHDWLAITVPLLAAMIVAAAYVVLAQPRWWNVRGYLATLAPRRTALAVLAAAAIVVGRAAWIALAGTRGDGPTASQFACEHVLAALRGPLWGPVHHVVYFGPFAIVAILAWRRVAALADEWGPACVVALAMIVGFAAGSQSRQWIHLFPLLVALAVGSTLQAWTPRRVALFVALALAWSKLWFVIGYEDDIVGWHDSPDQRYFMHIGPYATDESWAIHLVAAAATAIVLAFLLRRSRAG